MRKLISSLASLAAVSCFVILPIHSDAQNLLINEVCSKNNTVLTDPDGDHPDWIELYNAGPEAVNLAGYGLSDDPLVPGKWKFPSYTLDSGAFLTVFASDKNKNTSIDHWETVTFDTSVWKYTVPVADISNWYSDSFNDAGWSSGRGGIGYGDGDDSIVVGNLARSIYMRKSFDIADTSRISALALNLDYEDGFIAYLNGIEIARFNVEGTPPKYNKPAKADRSPFIVNGLSPEQYLIPSDTIKSLLKNGTNVLAIEVHAFFRTYPEGGDGNKTARPFMMLGFKDQQSTFFQNPDWFVPANQAPLVMHTPYKLSSAGETLVLTDPNNVEIDNVRIPSLETDHSYGRTTDAATSLGVFASPTPGASNNPMLSYSGYWNDSVSFSYPAGFYSGALSLALTSGNVESEIRFTTDGSTPGPASALYEGPIPVEALTVVKAGAFKAGYLTASFETNTYLINQNISLPVISISAEPNDFFGPNGIYTEYEQDYESKAHIEYFETDKENKFEQDLGVKIYGAVSRMHPMKSLRFIPRSDYGDDKIRYKLFQEKDIHVFDQIILRNSGNDFGFANLRDGLNHQVLEDKTEIDYQAYQPVVVFINGQYWGIHNMRERIGAGYVKENHGYSKSEIDLLEKTGDIIEGDNTAFHALINSSTDYTYLQNNLDIQNFVDYFTSQIYHVNWDWPGNNIKYWRPKNGKWRYLYYDTEFGLNLFNDERTAPDVNDLARILAATDNPHSEVLRNALSNPTFENYFINRYADLMNTIYTPANYTAVLDEMISEVSSEISRHSGRWGGGYNTWDFDGIRNFITARPTYARSHLRSQFGLSGQPNVTLNVEGEGRIKISTISPETYPWTGIYFTGNSVPLEAVAAEGYVLSHWTLETASATTVTTRIFSHNFTSATTVTAHFIPAEAFGKLSVSEINYHSDTTKNAGDWIELHNYGNAELDITGWYIKDEVHYNKYIIGQKVLLPGEYLVICSDTARFKQQHPSVTNFIGNMGFKLDNSGDEISIYNQIGEPKVHVRYNDKGEWPLLADGYGASLESSSPESDLNLASNWFSGCKGGSPGKAYVPCPCATPDLGLDRLLCNSGGEASLSTGISSGTNRVFRWYYNGVELTGLNVPQLTVSAAGTYRVIYDSLQCIKTDKVLVDEVATSTLPEAIELCSPSYTTLSAGGNYEMASYEWQKDGIAISEGYEITVTSPGTYSLMITSPGCADAFDTTAVTSLTAIPQDAHLCSPGATSLSVSGTGEYKWFDAETAGNVVAKGFSFETPFLSSTTTYYVEDTTLISVKVGMSQAIENRMGYPPDQNLRIKFTVMQDIAIGSVLVYPYNSSKVIIRILRPDLTVVTSKEFTTTPSPGTPLRLDLGFLLPPGDYLMDATGTSGYLYYERYAGSFPYTIPDIISLTSNAFTSAGYETTYPFFYDWEIMIPGEECSRVPVTAYIDDCGPVNGNILGKQLDLKVVPNPSSESFAITIPGSGSGFIYTITDINGAVIESGKASSQANFVGNELLPGVYFIKVNSGERIYSGKIIKIK